MVCTVLILEVGKQTFVKVRKLQIRKFLGSFRYRKSATVLGSKATNVHDYSANPQFPTNTAQRCLEIVWKVVFVEHFFILYKLEF